MLSYFYLFLHEEIIKLNFKNPITIDFTLENVFLLSSLVLDGTMIGYEIHL